ncbi:hypothetical protein C8R45DRAFT_1009631 [Mycena sanguinolenta]|nr:hypothetical protein C8R45DRAFT_1009631 [Mycena sanguinolenta]
MAPTESNPSFLRRSRDASLRPYSFQNFSICMFGTLARSTSTSLGSSSVEIFGPWPAPPSPPSSLPSPASPPAPPAKTAAISHVCCIPSANAPLISLKRSTWSLDTCGLSPIPPFPPFRPPLPPFPPRPPAISFQQVPWNFVEACAPLTIGLVFVLQVRIGA